MHLIKLCVGVETLEDLASYQTMRLENAKKLRKPMELVHRTRQMPKKREAIVHSGSLYWVIKGMVRARQKILELRPEEDEEGRSQCCIVLDDTLIETRPQPKRPFQGWRYLMPEDAPADLAAVSGNNGNRIPAEMRVALAELALI